MTLGLDCNGALYPQSQIEDYRLRGRELENYNVLDFFVDTYEEDIHTSKCDINEESDAGVIELRGRPSQPQAMYSKEHPRRTWRQRVIRGNHHRTLPNVVGRWSPRRDPSHPQYPYYCKSMLMLLKLWRRVEDLKRKQQTWTEAFEEFADSAPARLKRIMSGSNTSYCC